MSEQSAALYPGYKHVEQFGDDDEYEDNDGEIIEEVEYVTLDLGAVEPTLLPNSNACRIIVSLVLNALQNPILTCLHRGWIRRRRSCNYRGPFSKESIRSS